MDSSDDWAFPRDRIPPAIEAVFQSEEWLRFVRAQKSEALNFDRCIRKCVREHRVYFSLTTLNEISHSITTNQQGKSMSTVTGPTSSTDTAIVRWNGTSGSVVQDSSVTLDASGNMTGVASLAGSVTTTTQSQGDNSTKIATTAYVDTGLSGLALDDLSDVFTDYPGLTMYLGQGSGNGKTGLNYNTCLGGNTLISLVSGSGNTAIGGGALSTLTTGNYNVAVGQDALGGIDTAQRNVAVGAGNPLQGTSGDGNVAVGYGAFFSQNAGDNNIAIGQSTGATLVSGSNNILIGYNADVLSSTTSNYLDIGGAITGDMTTGPALMNGFTATTQSSGDNSTKVATTAYVDAAVAGAGAAPVVGTSRNAKISVTTASATATFTADEIIVQTALGGNALNLSSYSQSVNLGTTGAGGMDTGSAPNNGWVSLYAIAKPDGTKSILACNETTSNAEIYGGANMPSGYSYSALIGVWRTNGSGQFTTGYLFGRTFWHGTPVNVLNVASGSCPTTYTSITLTSAVPAKADGLRGTVGPISNNYSAWQLSTNSSGLIQQTLMLSPVSSAPTVDGFYDGAEIFQFPLPTSQTMYYKMQATTNSARMSINGYTF